MWTKLVHCLWFTHRHTLRELFSRNVKFEFHPEILEAFEFKNLFSINYFWKKKKIISKTGFCIMIKWNCPLSHGKVCLENLWNYEKENIYHDDFIIVFASNVVFAQLLHCSCALDVFECHIFKFCGTISWKIFDTISFFPFFSLSVCSSTTRSGDDGEKKPEIFMSA